MMNRILSFLSLTLQLHSNFSTNLAQSPAASPTALPVPSAPPPFSIATSPAPSPVPNGPPNITQILENAGNFTTFIGLLKSTHVDDQINSQLKDSSNGLTVFAPSDDAFSNLDPGTIKSLSDLQQAELVRFHFVPTYLSTTQFQNVTTSGNQVNVSTAVMNSNVSTPIYTDNQIAVYQVDYVLPPWNIFASPAPAPELVPAPAPLKLRKKKNMTLTLTPAPEPAPISSDGAVSLTMHGMVTVGVAVVAASFLV
ncbi:fasciclin-like arabinogalactan protein 12 [Cornus florida]|uniref:fasciclin-like arabinogalactan protein 12 n=1 Tax=Cornus florida TaxID=4283 RepID=UPI00289FB12B|nr:fasciclin-like arabinogalactan protein 12 [Cornus florida]